MATDLDGGYVHDFRERTVYSSMALGPAGRVVIFVDVIPEDAERALIHLDSPQFQRQLDALRGHLEKLA